MKIAQDVDQQEWIDARDRNNPKNEVIGHHTGRCMRCGSNNLWDDFGAYGCNACGAFWCGFAG